MKTHQPGHDIGLLPALAPDELWTKRIRELYGDLHARALADVVLANVAVHITPVPPAFGSTRLDEGRAVHLIPDTPKRGEPVYSGPT